MKRWIVFPQESRLVWDLCSLHELSECASTNCLHEKFCHKFHICNLYDTEWKNDFLQASHCDQVVVAFMKLCLLQTLQIFSNSILWLQSLQKGCWPHSKKNLYCDRLWCLFRWSGSLKNANLQSPRPFTNNRVGEIKFLWVGEFEGSGSLWFPLKSIIQYEIAIT